MKNIELRWYVREVPIGVSVTKKVKTLQWRHVAGYSTEPTYRMQRAILASLTRLAAIDKAERPEPPFIYTIELEHLGPGTDGVLKTDYDKLSDYADRMRRERDAANHDLTTLHDSLNSEVKARMEAESALAKLRAGMMDPSEEMLRAGWNADLLNLNGGLRRFLITFKAMSAVLLREGRE